MREKSVTKAIQVAKILRRILDVFLEVSKAPVELQMAFYKGFLADYNRLSKHDKKLVTSFFNILMKDLFRKNNC